MTASRSFALLAFIGACSWIAPAAAAPCPLDASGACPSTCGKSPSGACVTNACGDIEKELFAADTHPSHWPYFIGCTPEFSDDGKCHVVMHGVSDGQMAESGSAGCTNRFPGCGIHFSPGIDTPAGEAFSSAWWKWIIAGLEYADEYLAACGGAMAPGLVVKGRGNSDAYADVIRKHVSDISLFEYHSWGTVYGFAEQLPTDNRYNGGLCPDGECVKIVNDPVPTLIFSCWALGQGFSLGLLHKGFPTPTPPPVSVGFPNVDSHHLERYLNCHDAPDSSCAQIGQYSCGEPFTPADGWTFEKSPDANCPEEPVCPPGGGGPGGDCSVPTCGMTGDHSPGACCFGNADCDSGSCLWCPGPGGVHVFGYCA